MHQPPQAREPMFNLPPATAAIAMLLVAIEFVRDVLLGEEQNVEILLTFAFIPARYGAVDVFGASYPGGEAADLWTFLTYALLHGGWTHVVINTVWLIVFGAAVELRFGVWRYVALALVAAAAGAAAHLLANPGDPSPLVGASAAIAGLMGAAFRFIFSAGGSVAAGLRRRGAEGFRMPAPPLSVLLQNRTVLAFVVVWTLMNVSVAFIGPALFGGEGIVAWQAHLGGFFAGFLLFPLFDPLGRRRV
jgi:membrane associated rhomboid family serine protease